MAQWERTLTLVEAQCLIPSITRWLTNNLICNSSSRGPTTFFQPPKAAGTHTVHRHTHGQNTCTHKSKKYSIKIWKQGRSREMRRWSIWQSGFEYSVRRAEIHRLHVLTSSFRQDLVWLRLTSNSICSWGWPWTIDIPALYFWVLEFQVWDTTPGSWSLMKHV